jgi:hypothetical protein
MEIKYKIGDKLVVKKRNRDNSLGGEKVGVVFAYDFSQPKNSPCTPPRYCLDFKDGSFLTENWYGESEIIRKEE